MKKRIMISIMLMMVSVLSFSQKITDDFSGKWKTSEGKVILITKSGNAFTGAIEESKETIIENVHFTDGQWKGKIFKPGSSTKADCELVMQDNKLTITARKMTFSKTIVWIKL
ncbi:uncharacterized protein (DUF2147 family) [Algoriphagus sp. 4150]|uniref:hypothetical protein n=1 Tax=Algoriphagus sp. 4150 TaxID=2817756 RepID=UPI0028658901|nr:hypothetical protein [Algoriphagus sp. 4150]MDR7128031.1 uncharacterized protein (DUF2147 family) [Algoriphagus sp. 4150]